LLVGELRAERVDAGGDDERRVDPERADQERVGCRNPVG
jgi:hypothetical protein